MSVQSSHSVQSFPPESWAVVFGAGGIGHAFHSALAAQPAFEQVLSCSRRSQPPFDFADETTIEAVAKHLSSQLPDQNRCRLFINTCGFLHDQKFAPERSLRHLDPAHMQKAFLVNAIGPAVLLKHFAPLMPRSGKCVFVHLSAKVGSIGDNHLGGWHSYRASKAALNQIVRTAAIELKRSHPDAVLLAMHPGTVDTPLSAPFQKTGLNVRSPSAAVDQMLATIDRAGPTQSGQFLDYEGNVLPW
jgi:NAD(P)-dependent dehydrogenase (short-subunit alcohol dehydrogenase family)